MEQEIPAFFVEKRRKQAIAKFKSKCFRVAVGLVYLALYVGILVSIYMAYNHIAEKRILYYVSDNREPRSIDIPHTFVNATVTAYTSSVDETDENPFETASGSTVSRGTLACPSKYPFGTVVVINGKHYICEDRMNKRYRDTERFDIWKETKADAFAWGKKELQIKVYSQK